MLNTNLANPTHAALVEESLKNAYNTLSDFANSEEFLLKIQTAFGETFHADKLEGLRQQWIAGDFASLPQIEILTGTQLRGANAAYAGENNTIYFSEDFLSQYADNLSAINSVLLEELGHYVDWQINDEDTPGDEGELFSNLVQGFELSESQVQALQSEDDSVVLDLGNSFGTLQNNYLHIESSDGCSSSNEYKWCSDNLLKQIIAERGKNRVYFINGVLVDPQGFEKSLNEVDHTLNLTGNQYSSDISTEYNNSIEFRTLHNPSSALGSDPVSLLDNISIVFSSFFKNFLVNILDESIKKFEKVDIGSDEYKEYETGYWLIQPIVEFKSGQGSFLENLKKEYYSWEHFFEMVKFLEKYGELEKLEDKINSAISQANGSLENPPNDFLEAFGQFWSSKPSVASNYLYEYTPKETKENQYDWK